MAIIQDLGVDGGGIYQPLLKHKWRVTFQGLITHPTALRVQAVTIDRPKLQYEEVVLDRYNSRAYIAGKHVWEPINLTVEPDIGGLVAESIQAQHEQTQKLTGRGSAIRLPSARAGADYKFAAILEMLDGDNFPLETWTLESAWIQNTDWGDLDYATSEAVRITLTIRFDHARQIIDGRRGNATGGVGNP